MVELKIPSFVRRTEAKNLVNGLEMCTGVLRIQFVKFHSGWIKLRKETFSIIATLELLPTLFGQFPL